MEIINLSGKKHEVCKFCETSESKYVCPTCLTHYCSVSCYKSPHHSECSEIFFKNCVEEELKLRQFEDETTKAKQKVLESLQKIHDEDSNDNEDVNDDEVDSDDENIPDLEIRLKGVDLEDCDEVWKYLTPTEKQHFRQFALSDEAKEILLKWSPWWSIFTNNDEDDDFMVDGLPKVITIPPLSSNAKCSPLVINNIINVIHAYVYMILYMRGEHRTEPLNAICVLLSICDTFNQDKIFSDPVSPVASVVLQINSHALFQNCGKINETFKDTSDYILSNCIDSSDNCYKNYLSILALSDLHQIFLNAKKSIPKDNIESKQKFLGNLSLITKKNIGLKILKKLEFFIAYLKSKNTNIKEEL